MSVELQDPSVARMPDSATMLAEYEASMRRFTGIVHAEGEDVAPVRVRACPAWTVRGLLSHVTGVAAHVVSGAAIGDDVQAWIDREIAVRSDRSIASLVDEWEEQLPTLRTMLAGQPGGGLIIDTVTHEHDLRDALGTRVADHQKGLHAVLPAVIEHVRDLDPLAGMPGVTLRSPTSTCTFGGPEIGLAVQVPDDWELYRLLACRRSAEQIAGYAQDGDRSLLLRLVSRYPLPERPLDV